jgi:hypothetical protein
MNLVDPKEIKEYLKKFWYKTFEDSNNKLKKSKNIREKYYNNDMIKKYHYNGVLGHENYNIYQNETLSLKDVAVFSTKINNDYLYLKKINVALVTRNLQIKRGLFIINGEFLDNFFNKRENYKYTHDHKENGKTFYRVKFTLYVIEYKEACAELTKKEYKELIKYETLAKTTNVINDIKRSVHVIDKEKLPDYSKYKKDHYPKEKKGDFTT